MDTDVTITPEQLHGMVQRGERVQIVFVLGAGAFAHAHIPGSLHFADPSSAVRCLDRQAPVVVYCSDASCSASVTAQHYLAAHGFTAVRRLTGGLAAWQAAGLPIEGRGGH